MTAEAGDRPNAAEIIKGWGERSYRGENMLLIRQLREALRNDEAVASVLAILDGVCLYCFDDESPCVCMSDIR